MSFWCLQFPLKNERNQVDLRFHSSKVEFVRLLFGGNVGLKKSFQLCLTFSNVKKMGSFFSNFVASSEYMNNEHVFSRNMFLVETQVYKDKIKNETIDLILLHCVLYKFPK